VRAPKYTEKEILEFLKGPSSAIEIMKKANVSRATAYIWLKKYPSNGMQPGFERLSREVQVLEAEVTRLRGIEAERDFYRDLLFQDNMTKAKRRNLAKLVTRYEGFSIKKACRLLNISEGYYRSSRGD